MVKAAKQKTTKAEPVVETLPTFDDFLETLSDDDEDEDTVNGADEEEDAEDEEQDEDDESLADEEGEDEYSLLDEEDDDSSLGTITEDEDDEGEAQDQDESALVFEDESKKLDEEEEQEELSLKEHKKSLQKVLESDPDFFSFLKSNDVELLNFDEEDDDDEDEDEDQGLHEPNQDLEVASDSEAEEEVLDGESKEHKKKVAALLKKGIVNLSVIAEWEQRLTTTKDLTVLTNVIEAFECAVETILKEEQATGLKWKVEGSSNFNALMRLCIRNIKGFCVRFLCGSNSQALSEKRFDEKPTEVMEKSKGKWVKLRPKIKSYMRALVVFLKSMGNPEAIAAVLRHSQKMSGFWALMTTKSYKLLKTLVHIWSTGEDSCRVAAFLAIIRMANYNKDVFLTRVFKQMYMAYVTNCKFTSVNTWPAINFMRASLVEVYLLDTALSYSVAFPFIRQLAIHLRNAVMAGTAEQTKTGKKEASRIVYSWQFVHSVHVWIELLAQAIGAGDDSLKLLVYPIVQICLGAIKLIPTRKYIPLRFHIVRMLINLQDKTKIFIPVLPLVMEVLHLTDFGGKTVAKFSVRPLDLNCCLKVDSTESGYFKAVSEGIFDTLLSACKAIGTELAFPEIVCPTLIQLKSFLKKDCKNGEVSRKYKTLVEKIEAQAAYIKKRRAKAMDDGQVSLADPKSQQVLRVEIESAIPESPLLAYAKDYFKVRTRQSAKAKAKSHVETREERLIPKSSSKKKAPVRSDSENEDDEDKFGAPLFSKDVDEDSDDMKTKFDEVEDEISEKSKEKTKRKKTQSVSDDQSDEDKASKKSKKLKKKGKKAKVVHHPEDDILDTQDEVIDFELSD